MDFKYIEQLLERYWQCETSLEEEAQLRAFFTKGDVPGHLLRYKDLFVYQQLQQEEHLGADFDARVLARVEAPVVKARRMTLAARFMPLFKAAAVVAVVLSLGNMMQHSLFADVQEVAAADTIGKQISAPSVALSGEVAVTHEKQMLDSLHRVNRGKEIKE
ncbi:hypothetical protein [uncultured Bacteroides sp.]|jgi:hypothetical protein|uniref:hypothetical protein n=1 Tax=uncultured Bacteroides sp. TaxID=162156 RepID=UPI00280A9A92|nr:hypothetical protein [uncultured Bacteroides sp.]